MAAPLVRVHFRGVGHRFGRRRLFAGLTATVEPGEVMIVCGPNGTGKSTLLRLIAGLIRPAEGTVEIELDGRIMQPSERRHVVGYASPDGLPYRALTVRENLEFFARVRGLSAGVDEETVATLGLAPRLDQLVGELSSGYTQRVRLALAMQHRPPVLLLDEPGVTLDDAGQEQLAAIVQRQRELGLALVAANDPRDMAYGDRVMRLGG